MPQYDVDLSDGRTVTVDAPQGVAPDQLQTFVLSNVDKTPAPENPLVKAGFPMGGAVAGGLAGGPIGAAIGTAIAPGPGTLVGEALGNIVGSGLGAFGGSRLRDFLHAKSTKQPMAPVQESINEALPYGAFGAAGEVAGLGLKTLAPLAEEAPGVVGSMARYLTRPATLGNTALRSGAGGFAAGTLSALPQDHPVTAQNLRRAIQTGAQQAEPAALIGAGVQALPNVAQFLGGNRASTQAAESSVMSESERLAQSFRTGSTPTYLANRGHEIFDQIKQVALQDPSPIPLEEFHTRAVNKFGAQSPQADAVLAAFGAKLPETGPASTTGLQLSGQEFQDLLQRFPESQINLEQSSAGASDVSFNRPVDPLEALDTATKLSSKIRGGAASGYRRAFSPSDSLNADVRSVIYDVLRNRATEEGRQTINAALKQYGEFATLRKEALSTVSPFGNVNTPTAPAVTFLNRLASGEATPQSADDARLARFLQEASGQPVTATGRELTGRLPGLLRKVQQAKQYGTAGTRVRNAAVRLGFLYPLIRAAEGR